ncbi:MAG: hypothetical protein AAB779_01550 [Patescibacteria group bacterium]
MNLSPCASSEYPLPAKRPTFSVLNNTKQEPMRKWQEGLRAYEQEKK